MRYGLLIVLMLLLLPLAQAKDSAGTAKKPCVAVFPLAGDAKPELLKRTAFSLRSKLDRLGQYEVVDGPKMDEVVATASAPITLQSSAAQVKGLAQLVDADIILWGEISGTTLQVKILDLRQPNAKEQLYKKEVPEPTDLRFAVEEVLQTIQGVGAFAHPVEESLWNDPDAHRLWRDNPNLLVNGDFSKEGQWTGIYQSEFYVVPTQDSLPAVDKVAIVREKEDGQSNNVLAMNLSKYCAENNGMAALSEPIKIEPNTRYRISFRYQSNGPVLHVFVKGYTLYPNAKGELVPREIYRRQVPPSEKTNGQWVTIVDDFNPQHVSLPVQTLKVDLYAYLNPGVVKFDDVVVKAVGKPTRAAKDAAIKPTATRPSTLPVKAP